MIPTIGIMIGFYIIARMIDLAFSVRLERMTLPRMAKIVLLIVAVLTIAVSVLSVRDLIASSLNVSSRIENPTETETPMEDYGHYYTDEPLKE